LWIGLISSPENYRDTVIECLEYCIANKAMLMYTYVIMSNHIDMIVQSSDGELSDLLRDFKKIYCYKLLKNKNRIEQRDVKRFKLAAESPQFGNMAIIRRNLH
jgi:REP element-mobilizing transposase RayT